MGVIGWVSDMPPKGDEAKIAVVGRDVRHVSAAISIGERRVSAVRLRCAMRMPDG